MRGPLGDFLNRFKKISIDRDIARENFIKSVKNICGASISINDFSIKDGIVTILGSAALKNTIFMKKKELLARANLSMENKLYDIR